MPPDRDHGRTSRPCRSPRSAPRRARDRRQPAGVLVLLRPANEFAVKGGDPTVELGPLGARVGNQQDHPWAQSRSALLVHERNEELLELALALGGDDSALQKDRAQTG